ncbi:DUF167 domain-containing protein [Candidatus Nanohalococcus occultus]|uniref:YggU, DUF167 family n=1 Tax=Candidatus Nanohalococcus occultus TaxID=2978047 RepID=A0ABY8CH87_9ARCH|nr:YggU, DUF167 family [Candidatus Nanohaloarchaeota archaeon SVXNc]
MTEFYVKVNPGSEEFKIENGLMPEIYLISEPENGRANSELTEKLSQVLDSRVGIVSGAKSRRKKLVTDLTEKELEKRLSSIQ